MDQTPSQLNSMIRLLTSIDKRLGELVELKTREIPKGIQFSVDGQVQASGDWTHIPFRPGPLFGFTLLNNGVVGVNASVIQYRLEGSTGSVGNVNIGDAVPFSATVAIFHGIEVRVPPGTTIAGAYRIIGIA